MITHRQVWKTLSHGKRVKTQPTTTTGHLVTGTTPHFTALKGRRCQEREAAQGSDIHPGFYLTFHSKDQLMGNDTELHKEISSAASLTMESCCPSDWVTAPLPSSPHYSPFPQNIMYWEKIKDRQFQEAFLLQGAYCLRWAWTTSSPKLSAITHEIKTQQKSKYLSCAEF